MTAAREQELLAAICREAEGDELRRKYADEIRPYDAPRARFIDLQLERAAARRWRRTVLDSMGEEEQLLQRHRTTWAHTIAKYSASFEFYRGFIYRVRIDPYVFLEYGEWLMVNAPIRFCCFTEPEDGPFPWDELLATPLLSRLDAVSFAGLNISDADVERIARSNMLSRCIWLDLSFSRLGLAAFEAIAASNWGRRLLIVGRDGDDNRTNYSPAQDMAPTDRLDRWDARIWEWQPVSPEGQELERKYGYIPWLHHENWCEACDARWYVDHGVLPVKPAGSPVE